VAYTLNSRDYKASQIVVYRKQGHPRESGGVQKWEKTEVSDTLNVFDNTESRTPVLICQVFDGRGNGDGGVVPTITGDHQNRITDYTAIVLQEKTGTLSPGAHAGSYNGQDAYNDMLVVDDVLHRKRTSRSVEDIEEGRSSELHARSADNFRGGW
jgi:hypothetical protein